MGGGGGWGVIHRSSQIILYVTFHLKVRKYTLSLKLQNTNFGHVKK